MSEYEKRKTKKGHSLQVTCIVFIIFYISSYIYTKIQSNLLYVRKTKNEKKETPGYIANRTTCIVFIMI